ncbi:MAG: HAD-IIB family hydrolase [Candidatus Pacebacteria bacterium]|nr:HAD-IIB family hydrolase [Candidatus Paceibacterota bacterium]
MKKYRHLFFDMDQTIAPARQPVLPEMFRLLSELPQDIIIVSGQEVKKIGTQSNQLPSYTLGQCGNHATDLDSNELWNILLDDAHRKEIMTHIEEIMKIVDHEINHDWKPIEDRGAQITFSPIGNVAPNQYKVSFDPDRKKREGYMKKIPFESEDLVVKIGGSTSLDYIHRDRHKGTNVQKLIDLKGWNKDECIYFGDGLYPGGNDEAVIGVIETVPVDDHLDTYRKLLKLLG